VQERCADLEGSVTSHVQLQVLVQVLEGDSQIGATEVCRSV
jgi:hypothetical protein